MKDTNAAYFDAARSAKIVNARIFTPDCPYLAEDAVFGVKKSLIADFRPAPGPREDGALWLVDWDFILAPA